jgi:hypothetical protein
MSRRRLNSIYEIYALLSLSGLIILIGFYTLSFEAAAIPSLPHADVLPATAYDAALLYATDAVQESADTKLAQHVASLKKRLPGADFNIVVQSPFVVIGDEPAMVVQRHAEETVKWAVEKLKQDFFKTDPAEILDIWLFKDTASYERNAHELFGQKPDTPYGYYSPADKALIMNISTGGGTLVHEIVHPFMESNFPACPPWFNEGLGSLYEQSGEVKGHIHGYTNWRLPGLQQAISENRVPSFKKLTAMSSDDFYQHDEGTNYAQARYLCYYLQERGLLVKFYKEFVSHQQTDPTGYDTLRRVLGRRNMNQFQKQWEKFVLGLSEDFALRVADS